MKIGNALPTYQSPPAAYSQKAVPLEDSPDRVELTPSVRQKWDQFKLNNVQRQATLAGVDADGTVHLEGVRWGFKENGPDASKWEAIFKDVKFNPADVKDIYLGVEPFAPEWIAGHGQAVIEFNKPITNSDGETDNRLVISMEAWTAPGESYGVFKGLKKNFGTIYQVGSFSDRVQRQCRKEGRSIVLHRLNLTPEQKVEFVKNSLDAALQDRTGEFYNTLTNSCFDNQVVQLNKVLPNSHQISQWTSIFHLPKLSGAIPGLAGIVLERHGLRTPDKPIQIVPDAELHPGAAPKRDGVIAKASQNKWWGTAWRVGGAALGASVAGNFAGIPGAIAGGLALSWVGGVIADQTRILNSSVLESPNAFYPAHVKAQLARA